MNKGTISTVQVDNIEDLFVGVESDNILTDKDPITEMEELNPVIETEQEEDNPVENTDTTEDPVEDILEVDEQTPSSLNPLVGFFKKKIESGEMFTFDDYDENKQSLDEYLSGLSDDELDQLYKANKENEIEEIKTSVPKKFYDSLPDKLKVVADYVSKGGQDLESMFSILAKRERANKLDPEANSKEIVRQYLNATKFGTEEEINEQITEWEDDGRLNNKASIFKPKLVELNDEIVQQELQQQETLMNRRREAAEKYTSQVQEQLNTDNIGGVHIDDKMRSSLTQGLLSPSYTSVSGNQTNELGHLLEKYQYVEPNHTLIAEALWLLKDPEGYREAQRKVGSNKTVEQTVKKLKTEMGNTSVKTVNQKLTRNKIPEKRSIFSRY